MTTSDNPWDQIGRGPLRPGERCGECASCRFPDGSACEMDPRRREQVVSDGRLRRRRPDGTWEVVE